MNSISLAKNINYEKIKKGKDESEIWPFESYLWIINDYLENGYYFNREKFYSNSYCGKIEWKKTLKNLPVYSDGNIIYDKLITSKMSASNDIVAQIFKLCLKQSINRIGWLYNYNLNVDVQQLKSPVEMVSIIKKELLNTFDDIKRMRFNHMLKILKAVGGDNMISNSSTYGIENYYYVFETMVDMLFDGIKNNKKKYNPNGYWKLNNKKEIVASSLRPDTILKRNGTTYILDAKMYQYGATHNKNDLPETQAIEKQITYGDYVFNNIGDKHVRNAFILPYNKELNAFKNDEDILKYNNGDLVYFGYARVDWREEKFKEYDYIYTYGIDFNYLLRNYKKTDTNLIEILCASIENQLEIEKNR